MNPRAKKYGRRLTRRSYQAVLQSSLCFSVLAIPLKDISQWKHLKFGDKKQNKIALVENGLEIQVKESSSPLVYELPKTVQLESFVASAKTDKPLQSAGNTPMDWEKADDAALRIGVVTQGDRKFSWFKRLFIPSWLTTILEMNNNEGFGEILFFMAAQAPVQDKAMRHPEYEFVSQQVVTQLKKPGPFLIKHSWEQSIPIFGIWVQSDGDDTKSSFITTLEKLELTVDGS